MSGSAPISINPNSSGYSIQVPLNDGDQIIFANETYIVPNSDPLGRKLARSEK